ncbi:YheC/YheD family protein [Heyndrickxia oleronia]|uniref:YheC/YheD family endospore coat-associated protein n=1 Tax=Heyndrickxia oleronia TaxID=38875 RepID=UPI00203AC154|nr:YheC/YheD family protein [Heyndrickxia oleronia]MCM3456916.1 YheC/YheD family protein [Heyndrickxia oleronia]
MPKRYKIEFFEEEELVYYYPNNISIEPNAVVFGTKKAEIIGKKQPNGRNTLSISTGLAKQLTIPTFLTSITIFQSDSSLIFGPLVGIFTSGFTNFPVKPIGGRSNLFSKLLSLHSSVGVVPFLFGEQHINWENQSIEGHFYHNGKWIQLTVPFPNVIYDRLPNRRSEKLKTTQKVKERLEKDFFIPWYNPGFFNKLDVYERLFNDRKALLYLPETSPFTSFHQVERMLSKYGQVYIKPINGSLGLGVHQVIYDRKTNHYYCRYHDTVNHLLKFSSLESLINHVFANKNLDRMLVQQGIQLIRDHRRPVDFRVHANKDENGSWKISAIAAKIAGSGSPTTHVKTGGEVKTLTEIFPKEEDQKKYKTKLEHAAMDLAVAIEKHLDGIIGEIGFDFGIDTNGNVWLFEANSKPGRSIFSHPGLKDSDVLTRKLTLSYAIFLTKKHIHEDLFI